MNTSTNPCELILALDVTTRNEAMFTLDKLGKSLDWVKVGLQLFTKYGPDLIHEIDSFGYRIFLDLKLHDIPNTVANSIESICALPVEMTTLHTMGGTEMLSAANEMRLKKKSELKLLGVTILTSHDQSSLTSIGFSSRLEEHSVALAKLGVNAGLQGLICSPLELESLRKELPADCLLVTPGIRPFGSANNDQKRSATPGVAAEKGASFIVVGRPILTADNPKFVVECIREELAHFKK